MKRFEIGDFEISEDNNKVFVIAELSANHNQDIEIALNTIKAAKRTGADCIKFQTYTADTMTIPSRKDDFIVKGTIWEGRDYHSLYQEAYTPWEWHEKLFQMAKDEGLECFSTPFDKSSVDFLENLNVPAYKIASFEITDIPLIEYVASKGKPIVISTGIATEVDIQLALKTIRDQGVNDIAVLKCTSSYPAPIAEANLIMIKDLAERFDVLTGLSDHTIGSTVPIIATSLGAKIVEKHFILDRSVGGPDSSFSMNEGEFTDMVKSIRDVEKALGTVTYDLTNKQIEGRQSSRSLYVTENVKEGDIFNEQNVRSIRPGFGLHPKYLKDILGKKANQDIEKGTRFDLNFI